MWCMHELDSYSFSAKGPFSEHIPSSIDKKNATQKKAKDERK